MIFRAFLLTAAALLLSCDGRRVPPGDVQKPLATAPSAIVTLKGRPFKVKMFLTEKVRRHGTVNLEAAPEGEGYLFAWPRNRYVKLESEFARASFDVAFLKLDGKVADTQSLVRGDREGVTSRAEAAHALLLPGGTLKELGVKDGDAVVLSDGVKDAPVQDLMTMKIGGVTAHVHLALTAGEREHGFMFWPRLSSDDGMLFCYDYEGPRGYWMKNTLIPLDIAFFGKDGTFFNVNETPTYPNPRQPPAGHATSNSTGQAQYVLEMNLGWFKRHGLVDEQGRPKPGLKVEFPPEALRLSFDEEEP